MASGVVARRNLGRGGLGCSIETFGIGGTNEGFAWFVDRRRQAQPDLRELEGVRVLVLDDEPDVRDLLRRLLASEKATVIACESSLQAMEVLEQERVDLILSDIGMPVEDGYTFLRRVREMSPEAGGLTPAVALTAYARPEDRIAALQSGFQHHLTKPIEPAELIAVVASLVRR